jgi:hypothetical protein
MALTVLELSESVQRAITTFMWAFVRTDWPIKGLSLSKIEATPVRELKDKIGYGQRRQVRKVSFYDYQYSRKLPIVELMMFREGRFVKGKFADGTGWNAIQVRYHPYIEEWESDETRLRQLRDGKTTWPNAGSVQGQWSSSHGNGAWYLGEWQNLSGFKSEEVYDQGERVHWDHPLLQP